MCYVVCGNCVHRRNFLTVKLLANGGREYRMMTMFDDVTFY